MKRLGIIILSVILLAGCKKIVEQKAQDAIMKAMTDGQWKITSFTSSGTDITSDFTNYQFRYYDNYTVDAINNGTVEKTGSWQGDVNTMSITANFTNAVNPLDLLNGTWHITDNSWTYVNATMTVGTEVRTLRLEKL
jgi:PBP1b-binding outer membrane lipoprotein LpoB